MATSTRRTGSRRLGTRGVPRAQREPQMLEIAGQVFASRGFHDASMDEIAAAAGISKPMLYAYFDSKEGLYCSYIQRSGARLIEAMDAVLDPELGHEELLWHSVLAFLGYVDDHRQGWAVLYRELGASGGRWAKTVAEIREAIIRRTVVLLSAALKDRGTRHGDPEAWGHAFIGAGESLANWWLDHPEEAKESVAARLMDTAWVGLGQVVEGSAWRSSDPRD
jgi:AcrR family transcriptional regulator